MNKLTIKKYGYKPIAGSNFNLRAEDNLILLGLLPILTIILFTVIIFSLSAFLPKKLPLFYSLAWGDKQLVEKHQFLILPAILAILTLVNLSLFWKLKLTKDLLRKILMYSLLIITAVLMITFIRIILTFI